MGLKFQLIGMVQLDKAHFVLSDHRPASLQNAEKGTIVVVSDLSETLAEGTYLNK